VKKVTKEITNKYHTLEVTNTKGLTEYKFMLEVGQKPKEGKKKFF